MAAGDVSTYPLTADASGSDAALLLDVRAEGILEGVHVTVSKTALPGLVDWQLSFSQTSNYGADDDNSVIVTGRTALTENSSIFCPFILGSGLKLLAGERLYLHTLCGAGTAKVAAVMLIADKATRPSPRRR